MTSHIQSVILDESCEFTSRKKGTLLLYPQLFPLSYHCTTMFHDSTQHLREFIHIINLPWSMIVALGFGFVSPLSPHSIWDSYNMFYTRLETIWGWFAQYIIPKIYGEVMADTPSGVKHTAKHGKPPKKFDDFPIKTSIFVGVFHHVEDFHVVNPTKKPSPK